MICAYDRTMLSNAQNLMGCMLDFAVYGMGYELDKYYNAFLASSFPRKIERGDAGTIMGKSGIELAYDITGDEHIAKEQFESYEIRSFNRSREYWTGWAIAHFQWETSLTFEEINDIRDIESVTKMYSTFHEMDITQFSDRMKDIYREKFPQTRLKIARQRCGMSQRELSEATGIPLKTIQQYEQRQKSINNAKVDYLIVLSRELGCDIELLVEKI